MRTRETLQTSWGLQYPIISNVRNCFSIRILKAFGHLFDVSLHEIQCHQEPINGARWNTVLPVADVPEVFAVLNTGGMLCMSIALAMFMIV